VHLLLLIAVQCISDLFSGNVSVLCAGDESGFSFVLAGFQLMENNFIRDVLNTGVFCMRCSLSCELPRHGRCGYDHLNKSVVVKCCLNEYI